MADPYFNPATLVKPAPPASGAPVVGPYCPAAATMELYCPFNAANGGGALTAGVEIADQMIGQKSLTWAALMPLVANAAWTSSALERGVVCTSTSYLSMGQNTSGSSYVAELDEGTVLLRISSEDITDDNDYMMGIGFTEGKQLRQYYIATVPKVYHRWYTQTTSTGVTSTPTPDYWTTSPSAPATFILRWNTDNDVALDMRSAVSSLSYSNTLEDGGLKHTIENNRHITVGSLQGTQTMDGCTVYAFGFWTSYLADLQVSSLLSDPYLPVRLAPVPSGMSSGRAGDGLMLHRTGARSE